MIIDNILGLKIKPKEKQVMLVEAVVNEKISAKEFLKYFESADDVIKGTCADAMKHISAKNPAILAPYLDVLINYINYKAPRVKWGIPESIGNMAKDYPYKAARAIPNLLKNTTAEKNNTTVIKWCAAFALAEIVKYNSESRKQLLPIFTKLIAEEKNTGVKNVYIKATKKIEKQ